ncbi:hypothetical protein F511_46517 [Dorcoceras hygrometricum]|uniref:Uncharacterized protein n=1 Tax=Dorcoceras hygrometricum TaxID=472368 RepID=A0A2Z7A093_9LAMI|nr:hypothetical protein F511_46517 [Dorcoceras hygrometricum]
MAPLRERRSAAGCRYAHRLHEIEGSAWRAMMSDVGRPLRAGVAPPRATMGEAARCEVPLAGRNVAPLLPRRCTMDDRSRSRRWSTHAAHWLRTMRAARATLCVCRVRSFFRGGGRRPDAVSGPVLITNN